jgi:hypothetical protein
MSVKVTMSFFVFRLISISFDSVNILYTAVILGSAGSKKKKDNAAYSRLSQFPVSVYYPPAFFCTFKFHSLGSITEGSQPKGVTVFPGL